MAIDGFLQIDDIPGESRREGHEDEIEIHGIEFGLAAAGVAGRRAMPGTATGRVELEPVRVAKHYDRSSPLLKQVLARSQRLEEAVISVRRTVEGETSDYLVVTLTEASVIGYDLHPAPEDDVLEELVYLDYASISFRYEPDSLEVTLEKRVNR
ncbi:Hcp family type VI secretion system effector [Pseudactinotalea suaedae]|uniref:Hcp family type VI secretion system effector n=1 Tax=Pseudactinotalea suaedae TaxID=1524924 RepID=UPI0012E27351|nr:type VI secretion system tube protein Hcp [Pseudactinotalea suaedae]